MFRDVMMACLDRPANPSTYPGSATYTEPTGSWKFLACW